MEQCWKPFFSSTWVQGKVSSSISQACIICFESNVFLSEEQVYQDMNSASTWEHTEPPQSLPEVSSYRRVSLQRSDRQLPAVGFDRARFSCLASGSAWRRLPSPDWAAEITGKYLTTGCSQTFINKRARWVKAFETFEIGIRLGHVNLLLSLTEKLIRQAWYGCLGGENICKRD